jgi:hypothetical protein
MKVIFIQYWILATTGFSEMKLHPLVQSFPEHKRTSRDVRKDLALDVEGERDDQEHEQRHLKHQQQKDLSHAISNMIPRRPQSS